MQCHLQQELEELAEELAEEVDVPTSKPKGSGRNKVTSDTTSGCSWKSMLSSIRNSR